jgi:citrate synthase
MKKEDLGKRTASILSTKKVVDVEKVPVFVKNKKLVPTKDGFSVHILSALLPKKPRSKITSAFAEAVFSLLIDHGGHVSGAVNTMITARAGKDLVSSLSSGLLTIGPRFGGAINDAARGWLSGVTSGVRAADVVEQETRAGRLILGIGHKKYRVGLPDPRVAELSKFASLLKKHRYYDFARSVERITTAKKGNLILNVDGVVAALMLDILAECEGYDEDALKELIDAEFFNALFVIPRSVGFIAHFMEQKRNDEGLFRLPDALLFERE